MIQIIAWILSWWYSVFGTELDLDFGQILGDCGAIQSPHIIGIGKIEQGWGLICIMARLKALKRII